MPNDPSITPDDLRQEYAIVRHTQNPSAMVSITTFVQRRKIDAARKYTRHDTARRRIPLAVGIDPLKSLISNEQTRMVQEALRLATPSQRKIARLLMNGLRRCEIANRLGVSRSSVTHTLRRLRPLLANVR